MKKTLITFGFCAGLVAAVEAAPTDAVTQADLQALKSLIQQQNAKIEAQAKRIAELEGKQTATAAKVEQVATAPRTIVPGEGTETNETGRIWTMADGRKFYLADATAGIFNPLTESGLQFEPYGYLVLEAVHNTAGTDVPMFTDWVRPRSNRNVKNHNGDHTSTLSVNDSILGFNLFSAESYNGWKTGGKFEFDLAGDNANKTRIQLCSLRLEMGERLGLRDKNVFKCLWIIDFPLFEWSDEEQRLMATHHPFTMPNPDDIPLLDEHPEQVRAKAYDFVCNGIEVGGGSLRIHDTQLQEKMFEVLGFTPERAEAQFGFLMNAFKYGAPPHAGLAFGLDRFVSILAGLDSIRDCIAFPKNNSGRDVMLDAPSELDPKQLDELEINLDLKD